MKKTLLALVVMTIAYGASAQIEKGRWLAGGNITFTSESTGPNDVDKFSTFTFSPDAGYFFIDHLAAGLRFDYTSQKNKAAQDAFTRTLIGPFVRYYILPGQEKINVFADGSFGFGSEGQGTHSSLFGYAIKAGPAFFLTKSVALEFALSYQSIKIHDVSDRDNTFSVGVGFQIHL